MEKEVTIINNNILAIINNKEYYIGYYPTVKMYTEILNTSEIVHDKVKIMTLQEGFYQELDVRNYYKLIDELTTLVLELVKKPEITVEYLNKNINVLSKEDFSKALLQHFKNSNINHISLEQLEDFTDAIKHNYQTYIESFIDAFYNYYSTQLRYVQMDNTTFVIVNENVNQTFPLNNDELKKAYNSNTIISYIVNLRLDNLLSYRISQDIYKLFRKN